MKIPLIKMSLDFFEGHIKAKCAQIFPKHKNFGILVWQDFFVFFKFQNFRDTSACSLPWAVKVLASVVVVECCYGFLNVWHEKIE